MKKIISLLLAAALCTAGLSASGGGEEAHDFFGYNTWYHRDDSRNYEGRSSFNNGKYEILIMYRDGSPSYYLRVDGEMVDMPFHFFIYKTGNSFIRIDTGEGAVNFSFFKFDISGDNTGVLLEGDEDADVVSEVTVKRTSSKMTLSYRVRKFDRELNENFGYDRVGDGWVVNVVDEFVNEGRDFLNHVIAENMYEYCFKNLGEKYAMCVDAIKELISHFAAPELRILRNLLFAMHGYSFKSADLNRLFSRFNWYRAEISDSSQIEFSEAEQEILDYIMELER